MSQPQKPTLQPPSLWSTLSEGRVALDLARMWGPLAISRLTRQPLRADRLVMVVPGFGTDDASTVPLRRYLRNLGYPSEGWGLGRNLAGVNLQHTLEDLDDRWNAESRAEEYRGEASVPYLCDLFTQRVRERHAELQAPISLVGWSLGGYIAREAARVLPDIVDRVVTMGSPTLGGPKYTTTARFFKARQMDLDWIEAEILKREAQPIQQPVTVIYSKSDGIVGWGATQDHFSPNAKHIEVNASHLGMGFNPTVWRHVENALDRDSG